METDQHSSQISTNYTNNDVTETTYHLDSKNDYFPAIRDTSHSSISSSVDIDVIRSMQDVVPDPTKTLPITQRCLAEFLGTFIFIFISLGTVNQAVLTNQSSPQLNIAFGFAIGLTSGIHFANNISGAHLNPSITFTMWVFKQINFKDMLYYMVAQFTGAFLAALLVFCLYNDLIRAEGYNEKTASLYGTYKNDKVSIGISLLEQIVVSALLMLGILRSSRIHQYTPVLIGTVIFSIALISPNGFAMNPCRHYSPLFVTVLFWGVKVLKYQEYFAAWVVLIGSPIGTILGWYCDIIIERYLNKNIY